MSFDESNNNNNDNNNINIYTHIYIFSYADIFRAADIRSELLTHEANRNKKE